MTKTDLIKITKRILKTDSDLDFLLQLKKTELETLVANIRERVEIKLWGYGRTVSP